MSTGAQGAWVAGRGIGAQGGPTLCRGVRQGGERVVWKLGAVQSGLRTVLWHPAPELAGRASVLHLRQHSVA